MPLARTWRNEKNLIHHKQTLKTQNNLRIHYYMKNIRILTGYIIIQPYLIQLRIEEYDNNYTKKKYIIKIIHTLKSIKNIRHT